MATKICCTCGQEKPIECFSRSTNENDGFKKYCKFCASIESARYRDAHKERIRQVARQSYHRSKESAEERTKNQLINSPSRVCSFCGVEKPITDFYKCGNGGFRSYCKKCANQKAREYRIKNRNELIEKKRQYNREHKADIDAYNKQYYVNHSDEIKARVRAWEIGHPERKRENGVFGFHNSRSRRNGIRADFTRGEWKACKEFFSIGGKLYCAYCGKEMKRASMDHVVPFEDGGEYTKSNIIPVCISCNASKGSNDLSEWYPKQSFYSIERENKIMAYLEQQKHANTERAT